MYCHYTQTAAELRIYADGNGYAERRDYDAIINVVWIDDATVLLRGAKGTLGCAAVLAVLQTLRRAGAHTLIVNRAKGRVMPFGVRTATREHEDTWRIDLLDLQQRGLIEG